MKHLTQEIFEGQPEEVDFVGIDYDGNMNFGIALNPRCSWASERWGGFTKIGDTIENSEYLRLSSLRRKK